MSKFITNPPFQFFAGVTVLLLLAGCAPRGSKVDAPVVVPDPLVVVPDVTLPLAEDAPDPVAVDRCRTPVS